jgi:hypothetical protein
MEVFPFYSLLLNYHVNPEIAVNPITISKYYSQKGRKDSSYKGG